MTKKVSFIVPCRDKEKFIADTVHTVLRQTYSPMEIVLSDQGSVDDSLAIMKKLAAEYDGPNKVRVLECPDTETKGMAGLNNHLNWLDTQIEGDIVIMCSADDLNHPERVEHTVRAFEDHDPSYVGTMVQYLNPDFKENKNSEVQVTSYGDVDRWVDPVDNVEKLVGSSASSAWSRDLFTKYGPMKGIESQDVLLPFFATIERGLYYVAKPLHAYIKWANENNTGLEGVMRAMQNKEALAKTEEEKRIARGEVAASIELVNFHCTSNWFAIMRRLAFDKTPIETKLQEAIFNKAIEYTNIWCLSRDSLILNKFQPQAMRV